ncbi:MAG TPA: LysM peptidoglycan-binding domain-containing protein, partial [Actinomycetota bacterium]|nr:LysM peptidoglycan-binding domain-containing protein [Actinomycetota bacterium]
RRGEPSAPAAQQAVVVQAGDTLWAIAERVRPGEDPRLVADEIAMTNGVQPGALTVGATLLVPLG